MHFTRPLVDFLRDVLKAKYFSCVCSFVKLYFCSLRENFYIYIKHKREEQPNKYIWECLLSGVILWTQVIDGVVLVKQCVTCYAFVCGFSAQITLILVFEDRHMEATSGNIVHMGLHAGLASLSVWFDVDFSLGLGVAALLIVFKGSLKTLKKLTSADPDKTHVCVCVYFPRKRFLRNYQSHHHQTQHGDCLRHDNASPVMTLTFIQGHRS